MTSTSDYGRPARRWWRLGATALTTAIAAIAFAGPAHAGQLADLLEDCADGTLEQTYPTSVYRQALADLPADLDGYTDCRETLERARLAAAGAPRGRDGATGQAAPQPLSGGRRAPSESASSGTDERAVQSGVSGGLLVDPLASASPAERAQVEGTIEALTGDPERIRAAMAQIDAAGDSRSLSVLPGPLVWSVVALLGLGAFAVAGAVARRLRR